MEHGKLWTKMKTEIKKSEKYLMFVMVETGVERMNKNKISPKKYIYSDLS